MTLEHYPGMAEAEIARHVEAAEKRWPLLGVTVDPPLRATQPGENIVLVVTASAHRQDAFAAAEFLMDYLKTRAPFWKQVEYAGGKTGSTPSSPMTRSPIVGRVRAAAARRRSEPAIGRATIGTYGDRRKARERHRRIGSPAEPSFVTDCRAKRETNP